MSAFPEQAKVVIIGLGGIVGASVAHHLIVRGWDDIVGIDKSGIPTDIGSTAHASDFCYTTSHDFLSCWTTLYSIDFYEKMGHYARIGGLEVARVGDDVRMNEIRRKTDSAKAFGTRARLIDPAEIKKKFPLIEEELIQGGLWDPDAGLVIPRSQTVAGKLVDQGVADGKLQAFANTSAKSLVIEDGRIKGVVTTRGTILADHVVVCAGLWGRLIAEMAGEDLPLMPVDHPLTFFGPYNAFEGTGAEIGWPLLRDQGNSAYMRDTGDPTTAEGGQIEWGYYEEHHPRLVHPRDLLEKEQARLSPSQRDLDMEQVLEPLERAMELTPILGELGYNESHSFNGLLQTTTDGGPSMGESQKVRGLWYAVGIWVKDGPGMGKLIADWMTDGRTAIDHSRIDYARFYPFQLQEKFIEARCTETARKIYNPPVHPREPFAGGRGIRRSPFYEREKELGGYFMELGGWERAHGYAANEHLLAKFGDRIPVRENEWDNRHFWRVSNAEHLELSENCGIINLSHFYICDIEGPDHVAMMEWLCAAKIGGDANIGKGIYTHFLDDEGMVSADFTVIRMEDRCRMINGADAGPRDFHYMRRVARDKGFDVTITDVSEKYVTIGIWGPNARANLQKIVEDPNGLLAGELPVRGDQVGPDRRQDGHGVPDFLRRRAGLGAAHGLRGRPCRLGRLALDRRHRGRRGDLREHPPHGEEPSAAERRPADRVQSSRGGSRPSEGQGGGLPRQGQASRVPRSRPPAGDALHAGHHRQRRWQGRRPLSGRQPARARPGDRRDARRRGRPAVLHHLDRLRAEHRQEHRTRLPALGLLPGGPETGGAVLRRDLSRRGGRRRLQGALRLRELEAEELDRMSALDLLATRVLGHALPRPFYTDPEIHHLDLQTATRRSSSRCPTSRTPPQRAEGGVHYP